MDDTAQTRPELSFAGHGAGKKAYAPPHLECLGDVRDVTLGGSPGMGDSGNSYLVELPGGLHSRPYPGSHVLPGGLQGLP